MVAGEEKRIAIQKRRAAAGVPGDGNDGEVLVQADGFDTLDDPLDAGGVAIDVRAMQDSLTTEGIHELSVIRDVIPMGEKQPAHAPQLSQPFD